MGKDWNGNRVTLATVAKRAGVSVTTVSSILSGRDELLKLYRPETIDKVVQTAERLNYRANLFATGLPVKRPPFFALVLQDFRRAALGSWHLMGYESSLMAGAIWAAMERRLYPVTAMVDRELDEAGVRDIARLIDGGVFGTVVRTPNPLFEKYLRTRYDAGHPLAVVFPRRLAVWQTNAIDVDNAAVGQMAARLLAERGRKVWTLVRYDKLNDADQLRCGEFLRVAKEAGAAVETVRVPSGTTELGVRQYLTSRWQRSQPDAVFAPENVSSVGSLLACIEVGMRPTEDFDLVGCDCASWHHTYLPMITCIDISWEQVGTRAVEELERMYEQKTSRFDNVVLKPRIVAGGTCPVPDSQKPVTA